MAYSYDGYDLNDGTNIGVTVAGSNPFRVGGRRHVVTPYADRPGAIVTPRPPGPASKVLRGWLRHATNWETARDDLIEVLSRPRRRFVCSELDSRWATATALTPEFEHRSPTFGFWSCEFVLEDYLAADVATVYAVSSAPSAAPAGGTAYRVRLTPTVAGAVSTPVLWHIINPSGGVTPDDWTLANVSANPPEYLWIDGAVAASTMLTIDPDNGMVYATPLTNVQGYWPLESTADYSGNGRTLTMANSPTAGVAGRIGNAYTFNGSNQKGTNNAAGLGVTGSFTICGWVEMETALAGTVGFFGKMSSNAGYSVGATSTAWRFQKGTGAATNTLTISHTALTAITPDVGRWVFLCGTYSAGNGMRFYIGDRDRPPIMEAANSTFTGAPTAGSNDFSIGAAHDSAGTERFANATIDEVALFSAELTAAQVYDVWRYGPFAFSRTNLLRIGQYPRLYPRVAGGALSTNYIDLAVNAGSAPATYTVLGRYRSRYE